MQSEWQKKDLAYNWHPYTQHQISPAPIVITKGKDARVWDEHNNEYIDAIGSWWANPHGHAQKDIAEAISQQVNTLEHVLFGGFTHPKAIELSELLLEALPHFSKVFYSDNGSTAVEVALKMALQYFFNQGTTKRVCIAFEQAFHGDTFGAMSASGISLFTDHYQDICLPVERIPVPNAENWERVKTQFQSILKSGEVYAFIFEPLVQGAAGMKMYESEYLDALIAMCKEYKVLSIADEVMTGFGRTGKLFACEYLQQKPDIICLSKALSGGFLPLSATLATQDIFQAFSSSEVSKALFHGHTFMANPAACAAGVVSFQISISDKTQQNIERIQSQYAHFREKLASFSFVKNIRQLGVIFAFEVELGEDDSYYGSLRNTMYEYFMKHHIIARPVGNTIYFLPAYCIENSQLQRVFEVCLKLLKSLVTLE